jgi:hypothetical protein
LSEINSIFKFFRSQDQKPLKFSILDLFKLYEIVRKRKNTLKQNLNFLQFYAQFYILRKHTRLLRTNALLHPFLLILFKLKTFRNRSLSTSFINKGAAFSDVTYSTTPAKTAIRLAHFWKKWGKLRRPESKTLYYLTIRCIVRYRIYSSLKLFKVISDHYILYALPHKETPTVRTNNTLLLPPKFNSTSMGKFLKLDKLDCFEFQYLRKNKVYNKGRYSRCRQNYRTGVYMCMYLSVVTIMGLYYWFYKFSFNFSYLWWLFIAFFGSFFIPKIVKYRLYEPTTLVNKFFALFSWGSNILRSFF